MRKILFILFVLAAFLAAPVAYGLCPDPDGDGVCTANDNCPNDCNSQQADEDGDGIGDVCDSSPGCGGGGWGEPSCEDECTPSCPDADGDGYSAVCAPMDCDDFDPAVAPGADETCGDGIDNNCYGGADEGCNPGVAWVDISPGLTNNDLNDIWVSANGNPVAVGDSGVVVRSDDGGETFYTESSGVTDHDLTAVYGFDEDSIYAVGDWHRQTFYYDGNSWNKFYEMLGATQDYALYDVWGTSESDMVSVGENNQKWFFHTFNYNVYTFSGTGGADAHDTGVAAHLFGISGTASNNWYAVGTADGSNNLYHFSGSYNLSKINTGTTAALFGVWASPTGEIFAVGEGGTIVQNTGSGWQVITGITSESLYNVWGSDADNVYAVGENGTILSFDGTAWAVMESPVSATLISVHGVDEETIFAVGTGGTILALSAAGLAQYAVVCDPATSLCWQDPQREAYNYSDSGLRAFEADQYCDELVLGGLDDWRVPTIAELRTITEGYANTETGGACPLVDGTITYADAQNLDCFNLDDATFHNGPGDNGCFLKAGFTGTCDKPDPYSGGHPLEHVAYETPADTDAWRATLMFENGSVLFNHGCTGADVRCVRDDDGSPIVDCVEAAPCVPDETKACPCVGFGDRPDGVQTCNELGDCWGPCDCADSVIDISVDPECHQGDVIYDQADILTVNISLPVGHTIDYDPATLQTFLYECPDASTPIPTRPPDGGSWENQMLDPGQPPYSVEVRGVTYYREESLTGPYCLLILMAQKNVIPPMPEVGDYFYWDASQPIDFPISGGGMTLDLVLDRVGGCPAETPYECPGTGVCEVDAADCCPVELPYKCENGTCVTGPSGCGPDECGDCTPPCPNDDLVFSCRYPGFMNFYTGCADFPPSEGWPAGDTPENWSEMQALCDNMPNNSGAGTVSLGQTCRYYEGGITSSVQHCIFEAEDGVHDGLLYYAIGINSIGCAAQYGAVSSLLDGPLCVDY